MVNILVTGANGQLGNEISKLSKLYPKWQFCFTDVDVLDITDLSALQTFCNKHKFNYIINCAAYTAVDKAETEVELATRINRDAVKNLTLAAVSNNSVFIHISTDYVFDGKSCTPYLEDHPVDPQSSYGRTKAEGEKEALKYNRSIIIRTAWLYSTFGNNFVKTMLRQGSERSEIKVIYDQIGSPTYAKDLALAILKIVEDTEQHEVKPGIYHFSNEGVASWYDLAWEVITYTKKNCKVLPIETKDYPLPAKRPSYSVFNKAKIKSTFNIDIPNWKSSLYKCLDELNNSK